MSTSLKTKLINKTLFLASLLSVSSYIFAAENPTFEKVCSSCHTGGFKGWVSGAPNINKKAEWEEFLERDSENRMSEIVLKGTDDHKTKGGCSKCSDESILGAVDYILSKVK